MPMSSAAGRLQDVEEVRPIIVGLPALAPASELVETDGGDRPEQAYSRNDREKQRHERLVGCHHDRRNADQGVDQAGEEQVAAHREEIIHPLRQRSP